MTKRPTEILSYYFEKNSCSQPWYFSSSGPTSREIFQCCSWYKWVSDNCFCFFFFCRVRIEHLDFLNGSAGKGSACNAGDTQKTWVREDRGREDSLEKETHSSIAWNIPWTEEPSRLQSKGLQIVGHDWVIKDVCNWKLRLIKEFKRGKNAPTIWKCKFIYNLLENINFS